MVKAPKRGPAPPPPLPACLDLVDLLRITLADPRGKDVLREAMRPLLQEEARKRQSESITAKEVCARLSVPYRTFWHKVGTVPAMQGCRDPKNPQRWLWPESETVWFREIG